MKYFPNYVNKEDLFQVGCIGLIKAYKKYNQNLNVKFSSFAYKYIWGEMKKYIREDKSFKVNREISNVNYKINQAINLLSQKLMREPSLEEVSRYLEIPINIINLAVGSVKPVQSLDEVVTDEDSFSLYELIPSKEYDIDIEEEKKSPLGIIIVIVVLLVAGYFGYKYYLKNYKKY